MLKLIDFRLDGWRVPSIRPLETLHNALTLRQVENFIKNVTELHCQTLVFSPSFSTPVCVTPRSLLAPPSTLALPITLGLLIDNVDNAY